MPSKPIYIASGRNSRGEEIRYRAGHLIIKFDQVVDLTTGSDSLLDSLLGVGQYGPVRPKSGTWHYLYTSLRGDALSQIIADLNPPPGVHTQNHVEFAQHDIALTPCSFPKDPMLEAGHAQEQWGPRFMNMSDTWEFQQGTEDVVIGLFDSGIPLPENIPSVTLLPTDNLKPYLDHEDLDGKRFYAGYDYVNGVRWPRDDYETPHGTHLAGIIAARQNNTPLNEPNRYIGLAGINWVSSIFAYKALHKTYPGDSYQATIGLILSGLEDTVEFSKSFDPVKKIIINLSLQDDSPNSEDPAFGLFYELIRSADAIVCIAAAGSSGLSHTAVVGVNDPDYSGHVIVVGACKKNDSAQYQHNFGNMVYAPGQDIWSTTKNHGYEKMSGTSPATAHVSGLASILWSESPHLGATDIVRALKNGCREPIETAKASYEFGFGRGIVDAFGAFQELKTRLCLVLDKSGSMSSPSGIDSLNRMEILKTAAKDIVGLLDSGTTMGMVSFDHAASLDTPPDMVRQTQPTASGPDQRTLLESAIDALEPGGMTSIGAGANQARAAIQPAELRPPKALLILTDGMENTAPFLDALGSWPPDINVFGLGMGAPNVLEAESLTGFAEDHGGYMITANEFESEGNNNLSKILSQILVEISDYSLLEDPAIRLPVGGTFQRSFPLGMWDRDVEVILVQPPGAPLVVRGFAPDFNKPWARNRVLTGGGGRVVRHGILRKPFPITESVSRGGNWRVEVILSEQDFHQWAKSFHDNQVADWMERGIPLTIMITTRSSLRMRCRIKQSGFKPGATMKLSVEFTENRLPHDANHGIRIEVTDPLDEKTYPPPKADGPGMYSCSITATEPGVYHWFIRAEGGSDPHRKFRRECVLTGAVWNHRLLLGPRPLRHGPFPGIPHP